jgi:heterotetrameric sarcosine oxidase delta subunit
LRDQTEFRYGGEAGRVRPADPNAVGDDEWAAYLFYQRNPMGTHHERWVHSYGCRRWFNVVRDTVTHEISAVYRLGEQPPGVAAKRTDQPT